MAYEYTIERIDARNIKITPGATHAIALTPTVITASNGSYSDVEASVTITDEGGTAVTGASGVYTLATGTGVYYNILVGIDGVYKFSTTENSLDYLHLYISTYSLNSYLKSTFKSIICCNPSHQCKCNLGCADYYDATVLSLLSMSYFGSDTLDITFDYGTIVVGVGDIVLHAGYEYECTDVGTTPWDWRETSIDLLYIDANSAVTNNATLVLNQIYYCLRTGIPDDGGDTNLTALTADVITRLNYIADSVNRVADYYAGCDTDKDPCVC